MSEDRIYLNGIDGVTGQYLVPPMTAADAVAAARGMPPERGLAGWLGRIRDVLSRPFLGLPMGVNPTDVSRSGWGIVYPSDTPSEVRDALKPLVAHRRRKVPPDRCKELEYRPNESMKNWLKRHGVYPGGIAPTRVPYYLLLVGDPTSLPFEFQYLLNIEYAVGRLAFDRPEQYRQYAESLVEYETSASLPNAREVVYWGPRHAADRATQLSADCLLAPLSRGVPAAGDQEEEPAITEALGYGARCLIGKDATKAALAEILHGAGHAPRPSLLFTASHGMGWPRTHQDQRQAQGALLCQDWSGFGSVSPGHYLAATDIEDDARLHGLVVFAFACYGAGTPQHDPFLTDRSRGPVDVAEKPFVAALPQRLLSHPQGGALAVIGHVERAWGYSIRPPDVGPQLTPFRNLVGRILSGDPVGHSTKDFSERYATLSADLLDAFDGALPGPRPSDEQLAWTWIERNDAQSYVVLGDPAVQIRVGSLNATGRPDSSIISLGSASPSTVGTSLETSATARNDFPSGIDETSTTRTARGEEGSISSGGDSIDGPRPVQDSGHAFGYVAMTSGKGPLPIGQAGRIPADDSLKGARITIVLESLRVGSCSGAGTHRILFDFSARNSLPGGAELIHFNTTFRVADGGDTADVGLPIFVGLGVGGEGIEFRCDSLDIRNQEDRAFLGFLDSDVFKDGLRLMTTPQPALAPMSATAVGLTRAMATRGQNVPIHAFTLGLDFGTNPTRARLAEGWFLAVQVPEPAPDRWDWGLWGYDPASGQMVDRSGGGRAMPYDYLVFKVSRFAPGDGS